VSFIKSLPVTSDMVSLWIPSGAGRAIDIIRGNHGQCYGTHPNVPVISEFTGPNLLTDGGLNEWDDADNLTRWSKTENGTSTVNREATEKIEGDYSCRLDIDASNSVCQIYQVNVPLTSLKRYKIIIWYKNSVAGKTCQFYIRNTGNNVYLKEDGTWNVGLYQIVLPNSLVWTPYELPFYAHADYSSYIVLLQTKTAPSSSIYFDNISIKELTPSLINPSVGWVFGGDDYISIPDDPSTNFGLGSFTLGAWVRRNVYVGGGAAVISKEDTVNNYRYIFGDGQTDNNVYMAIRSGANYAEVNKSLTWGSNWHRIIMVVDRVNNLMHGFANAVEIGTAADISSVTGVINPVQTVQIGKRHGGTADYFNGYQALHFLVRGAWSQAQVTNDHLFTKGLFAPRG